MRIALNERSQTNLLRIMEARGEVNPTHMLNILLSEAAQPLFIPTHEDSDDQEQYRQAA